MEKNQTSCPKAVCEKIFGAITFGPAFTTIRRISSRQQQGPSSAAKHVRNASLPHSDPPIKTKSTSLQPPKPPSKDGSESEVPIKFDYTTRLPIDTEKPKPITALNGSTQTNGQVPLGWMAQQAKTPKPSVKPSVPAGNGEHAGKSIGQIQVQTERHQAKKEDGKKPTQHYDDKFSAYIHQTRRRILSDDQHNGENPPKIVGHGHGHVRKDHHFSDYINRTKRKIRTTLSLKDRCLNEPKGDYFNWLSEVLEAVNKGFDDPDEVVVVGEVNFNKKSESWNSSIRNVVIEDEDDCVVLEGDPDKALSDVNDPHDDSDELLIVGQKGQVACRDFPHLRHDCAKFPFSSTSHEQHCELCHCFVCDIRAPCCYWGSGVSNTDHCHATNKEEIWKNLRKNFRLRRDAPVPVAKAPVTSHSTVVPPLNQAPPGDIIRLTTVNQVSRPTPARAFVNHVPQNHVPRPSTIRACSSSRYGNPYNPGIGSRQVLNKSMMHSRSQQLHSVHNTVIRRDRGIKISNLVSQFDSSNTMTKGLDTEVASAMYRGTYVPPENITSAHASRYQQNPASVSASIERNPNPIDWLNNCSDPSLGTYTHQSSSQPSVDGVFMNLAPSPSLACSQPVPWSNVHQDTNHVQNQNNPATDNGFSDFDFNWVDNISQSDQQPSSDYLQLQTFGSTNEEEPIKEVSEGDKSYYNELESLVFNNQSVPEASLTAGLNPPSPDHKSFGTGMLFFDIETSWDHLTRA